MIISTSRLGGLAMAAALSMTVAAQARAAGTGGWPSAGQDLKNSRWAQDERKISPKTVAGLQLKWAFSTAGDVTANPAVEGDFVYFPDSAGWLYKLNKATGALVWKRQVSDLTGLPGDFARATPAIAGDALIFGNQAGKYTAPDFSSFGRPDAARVVAVNKNTGALIWMTKVDPGLTMSFITHSAIVADGKAIVGLASNEELIAGFWPKANGWTWNFRGSVVALDVATGAIHWKTYMVPPGYYGGAVWGSTGAVDRAHGLVYMATGNNYWVPQTALDCLNGGGTPAGCMSPDNHFNSIVAMDLKTGAIKWGARGLPYDVWNVGCGLSIPGVFTVPPNDNCPNPKGPDWDFAQGPMLFGGNDGDNESGNLVGAGQKSGMFWAFNAKTGKPAWSTQVAPPGLTGGLQWGSATDGRDVFVAVAQSGLRGAGQDVPPWTLKDGSTTTAGGWAALDAKKGKVLWTTKDPLDSRAEAAVSGANGVIFGCNLDQVNGTMYALDAKSGKVLWSYNSGSGVSPFVSGVFGACNAGPSIVDGMVFWGTGTFQGAPGPKKVLAFGL
ncbi:MAG: PQQ-binding-like beta-propeller repeat protein [Burkholderiaceae bacterium]|nr:PQQ-binding-like beta-propeller repeat protein [Burkholderiaceae bacterium]